MGSYFSSTRELLIEREYYNSLLRNDMKNTLLGFSQERLIELELDVIDAIILRWFVDFQKSGSMTQIRIEDGTIFYWVKYQGVINSYPILNLQKRTIQSRFMKLRDTGLLLHYTLKVGGTYSYFAINPEGPYESLLSWQGNTKSGEEVPVSTPGDYSGAVQTATGVAIETTYPQQSEQLPNNHFHKSSLKCIEENEVESFTDFSQRLQRHFAQTPQKLDFHEDFLPLYFKMYKNSELSEHPPLSPPLLNDIKQTIEQSYLLHFCKRDVEAMLIDYFALDSCDHNLVHFASGRIINIRIKRCLEGNLHTSPLSFQIIHLRRTKDFTTAELDFLDYYAIKYREVTGEDHPGVPKAYLREYLSSIAENLLEVDSDFSDYIDAFFEQKSLRSYNLGVFASPGALEILSYRFL